MAAGDSAGARGRRAREQALELARRSRKAWEEAGRWEAAAEAERQVAATLLTLTGTGWRLLVDRRWPGTRTANVDMILVGPGGVFVIDVKRWRDRPRVEDGHLAAGGERRDADVARVLAMARTAEEKVAEYGMSPVAVRPLIVFAGHRLDERIGRVRLLGHPDVVHALVAEPRRLTASMVKMMSRLLEEEFPAYEVTVLEDGPADERPEAAALFDVAEVEKAALESVLHAPIERWMTFLHADQVALVRRDWSGPARISGPAGTGKTVVALHRAAHLAARGTGRVLYVTFANNLPRVQGQLFQRLAGHFADRVEFRSLHGWAQAFLAERGVAVNLNSRWVDDAFSHAWMRVGRGSVLVDVEPTPGYWREEIDYVIKGRGITSLEEYREVARHGRRTALKTEHREAAWLLYEEYEMLRGRRGVDDFNDVLLAALDEVRRRPADPPYAAVIVDEVQDLTLVGVRLLHALAGDGPNGLLLIGDGQQAVYPGGFRLAEAGIAIKGRGAVLRTNYRNAAAILDEAMQVVSDDPFDDLEGPSPNGRRAVETAYDGGRVVRAVAADAAEHDRLLVAALRRLREDGDGGGGGALAGAAVLCRSIREIEHYHRVLTRAGLPVLRLENYDGRPAEAIKIGTYHRAKGLEFKQVFLPRHDAEIRASADGDPARERAELARRRLFVAMTRARDLLWLGSVGR